MDAYPLTVEQVTTYFRDGYLLIPKYYDLVREIEPIQRAIYEIVGLVIQRHGLKIQRLPFQPDCFDRGFDELIRHDRRLGGEVYDLIKMIPAFVRLAVAEKNEAIVRQLCTTDVPGFINRGYGIRIDIPGEDHFRALWHQEFLFQLRSLDGINFWSPLVPISESMGPVVFAAGSHRDGVHPVRRGDARRPGAYSLALDREHEWVERYRHDAPLSSPGDLIVLDFRTLHASGFNLSNRPRWSMQMRYFNFSESTGMRIGWQGSVADGVRFQELFPDLFIDSTEEALACPPAASVGR